MKKLLENLGLFIFIIAIILLVVGLTQGMSSNNILIISGSLIIIGLVLHVILGTKFM